MVREPLGWLLNLRLSDFHCWVLCWVLWVCYKWFLLCWDMFSVDPLQRVFIMSECWSLPSTFSVSIEMIMWLLLFPFVNMVHHIEYVEPSLGLWNEFDLILRYDSLLCIVSFSLLIFYLIFLHLYSSERLTCNFVVW